MITIVGTSHVFNLAESITFIVRNIWPDAVLVELDEGRLKPLTEADGAQTRTKLFGKTSDFQQRVAAENGTTPGNDMLAAVNAAKMIGVPAICIDADIMETMNRLWKEMGFFERLRYSYGNRKSSSATNDDAKSMVKAFSENEEGYISNQRRKYPTLVRVLIDERDELMANRVNELAKTYGNIVAVVGDGHVEGISKLMDSTPTKIRLIDLTDPDRLRDLKSRLWRGEA